MKAIILAAGTSSRLYPITLDTPKCLLEVAGRSIIDRQLEALKEFGIEDIVLVIGYKAEVIREHLADKVRYRYFDNFDKTNNLHTLLSAKDELDQEILCLLAESPAVSRRERERWEVMRSNSESRSLSRRAWFRW